MSFTTRRGRPKKKKEINPMIYKRLAQSMEALDYLYKKSLITEQEQWAGSHFRWLYGIRFGAPNTKAIDLSELKGKNLKYNDPLWQQAKEEEYKRAIDELRTIKAHKIILNIAVFNQTPKFITAVCAPKHKKRIIETHQEFKLIIGGLDALCKLWGKQNDRWC